MRELQTLKLQTCTEIPLAARFDSGSDRRCIAIASDTDRNSGNLILGMEMGAAVTSEFKSSAWT